MRHSGATSELVMRMLPNSSLGTRYLSFENGSLVRPSNAATFSNKLVLWCGLVDLIEAVLGRTENVGRSSGSGG